MIFSIWVINWRTKGNLKIVQTYMRKFYRYRQNIKEENM